MKLIDKNTASIFEKSSVMTGESVFTSILLLNGKCLFQNDHLERFVKGVNFLFSENIDISKLTQELESEIDNVEQLAENISLRITCFREGYFFSSRPWAKSDLNIKLGFSQNLRAPSIKPSFLKLSNYALEFKEKELRPEFDDFIYLDFASNVLETSTSNIFWIDSQQNIYTPKLSSMNLDGVMRKNLLKYFKTFNFNIIEDDLPKYKLEQAFEVFISNSIRGIRRVSHINQIEFNNDEFFLNLLNRFGQFGENFYE